MNKDQFQEMAREVLVRYLPPSQIGKTYMVKLDVYYANQDKMVEEIKNLEAAVDDKVRNEVIDWAKETMDEWARNMGKE